jgi:uncharacterized protein YnzC (UPF0291/DUF896 family)
VSTVASNSEAAIFGRLLQFDRHDLTPELAQHILNIGFPSEDLERINELAAKSRVGTLDSEERREIENYNLVGDLLALWHSKARRSLKQSKAISTHE